MQSTQDLLDAVKERHKLPSDYKLGLVLGISPNAISHYRKGRSHPDQTVCQRIAAMLEMDPDVVVCSVQAERASTDESRAQWERIAARLLAGADVVLSGAFLQPSQAADSMAIDGSGFRRVTQQTIHRGKYATLNVQSTPAGITGLLRRFLTDPEALAIV